MIKTLKKWASGVVKQVKSLVKKVVGYFAKAFVKEEPASTKSSSTTCDPEAQSTAVKESNNEAAEEVVAEEVTVTVEQQEKVVTEETTVEQQETVVATTAVSVSVVVAKEVQVTKLISTELVINDIYLLAGLLSRPPPYLTSLA